MDGYQFPCDPIASSESTIAGPKYRFTLLNDKVLRYEWAEDGQFEDRASTFALWRKFPKPNFRLYDKKDQLEIVTPLFHLTYNKQEFSPNGLKVEFTAKLTHWGAEWRYGQAGSDNLGGTARTLDGVDGRCDMGNGILSRAGYSVLDDSHSMLFDGKGFVTPRRPGRRIDGYLFAYGTDYKGAMESFYAVSGHQPSIPRWSLGNWWSRFYPYNHTEYVALMDKFRENDIPMSVAVIDMDWHWRKESFVPHSGWTGYTWNTNLFPSPKAFTQELYDRNLKITLNDHPHLGVHKHEDVYRELARRLNHDITHEEPIPFDPTSPRFMQAFFDLVHRKLEDIGCDFWWIDWQQGSDSAIPGFDPLWLLNHFQFLDTAKARPDSLPLIFSRYAGPGSHRYPVGFSGDSFATWASLQFQPEFTATASNIGFGWWSHDIGGHLPGERDDECTTRWVQYAVFSPALRLHSSDSRWNSKEPWLYRDECRIAMRNALQLRHRLVPYIYSVSASTESTLPLIQPLYWNFPTRDVAYQFPNQYFFGPSLVTSPVVTPRDTRTNLSKCRVWVPPQRHVDIFTAAVYDGDRELDMYRSLQSVPVLAPEGSIIPLDRETAPANGCKNPVAFEVIVVVGKDGQFKIVENTQDDRKRGDEPAGQRTIEISYDQAAGRLLFDSGVGKAWTFRFISTHIAPSSIKYTVDAMSQEEAEFEVQSLHNGTGTVVRVTPKANTKAVIEIGPNPQLTVHDHTETISQLLRDYQTGINVKDKIWDIIQTDQPTTVKIGALFSLGLEEPFLGPIIELLLADSRE